MAALEANTMSGWKLRNTAEISLLLSRANSFPTKALAMEQGGSGRRGTCSVLLCFNLSSAIRFSQRCLFLKHHKQLNPMGSTHTPPYHLLLKHTLTLILHWHKQYL